MRLKIIHRHWHVLLCSTCPKHFLVLHSWLITGLVTRLTGRVPIEEQELPTLPVHMSLPPIFSGVRVTRSLVLCVCFVDRCLSLFVLFLLAVVLSVLLFTDSAYQIGIFKFFLVNICTIEIYKSWIIQLLLKKRFSSLKE